MVVTEAERKKIKKDKRIARKRNKDMRDLQAVIAYKKKWGIDQLSPDTLARVTKEKKPRKKTKKTKRKQRKQEGFYDSREWRELRYEALKKYGRQCLCCGAKPPEVVLHVDHIKPRSKFPKLELVLDNLQILCKDCNLGKSNKDCIDYRI